MLEPAPVTVKLYLDPPRPRRQRRLDGKPRRAKGDGLRPAACAAGGKEAQVRTPDKRETGMRPTFSEAVVSLDTRDGPCNLRAHGCIHMNVVIKLDEVYVPADGVTARDLGEELAVEPMPGDAPGEPDQLVILNWSGKEIWRRLNGKATLADVTKGLSATYYAPSEKLESDVVMLVAELVRRKMLVPKPRT